MVAVVVLAIIAVMLIKALMSVVARDEAASLAPWTPDQSSLDLTIELRSRVHDDARAFLLPAVPEPTASAPDERPPATEPRAVNEKSR